MIKKFFMSLFFLITLISCSDDTVIRVGFIGDLTGSGAPLCTAGRNGVEMAITEINEGGGLLGRPVELLSISHGGSKDRAYSGVKELVGSGASLVVGPFYSSIAQAVIASSLESNMLIISPTVATDQLSGIDDNFLRLISPASRQGVEIANSIVENGNNSVLSILDEHNKTFTHAVLSGLQEKLNETDIIQDELYLTGTLDVESIISYIKNLNPEVIFFITDGNYAGKIAKRLTELDIHTTLYGATWTKATNVIGYGGEAIDGMIFVDYYKSKNPTLRELEFEKNYKDAYGVLPSIAAYNSYDAVYLYKRAVEESKSLNTEEVKLNILSMEEIEGINDIFSFDNYGDVKRKSSLYIVRNGKIVLLE